MKNNLIIVLALSGTALLYASCKPEVFESGALGNKADLKFTIEHSPANPNDIVLTSLTFNKFNPGANSILGYSIWTIHQGK
jgi:hypothetical protein